MTSCYLKCRVFLKNKRILILLNGDNQINTTEWVRKEENVYFKPRNIFMAFWNLMLIYFFFVLKCPNTISLLFLLFFHHFFPAIQKIKKIIQTCNEKKCNISDFMRISQSDTCIQAFYIVCHSQKKNYFMCAISETRRITRLETNLIRQQIK